MSVGRPRWTSPPTCSIACRTWDARATSASPDPDGVGGSATAALIRAPRWQARIGERALNPVEERCGRVEPSLPVGPKRLHKAAAWQEARRSALAQLPG